MRPEIESDKRFREEELPRYRLITSIPDLLLKVGILGLLTAYMAFVGYQSFGALQRVLTCAVPVPAPLPDANGDVYYDDYSVRATDDSITACVPTDLHASWLPAALGAVSMMGLAVLALIMFGYLLRLASEYIDQQLLQAPERTRGFHTVPDQVKHMVKGLLLVSGIFMLASIAVYCIIYLVALG